MWRFLKNLKVNLLPPSPHLSSKAELTAWPCRRPPAEIKQWPARLQLWRRRLWRQRLEPTPGLLTCLLARGPTDLQTLPLAWELWVAEILVSSYLRLCLCYAYILFLEILVSFLTCLYKLKIPPSKGMPWYITWRPSLFFLLTFILQDRI